MEPSSNKRPKLQDKETTSRRRIEWAALLNSVKIQIACFLNTQECVRLRQLDKATRHLMDDEARRGLDHIRLSYLNNNKTNLDRFQRLIELDVKPNQVWDFLQSTTTTTTTTTTIRGEPTTTTPSQQIVLQHMLQHNAENPHAPKFVIAGGSMLSCALACLQQESCPFGDVDVFVMELGHDRLESDAVVKNVLQNASKELSQSKKHEYGVLRNPGTLTMVVEENQHRPLQIVLRRVSCMEELLCFFDIDCCRFAFDGNKFYTTMEGLRSITLRKNFVSLEHVDNQMYCMRAIKYGGRGFETLFHWIHPLSHLWDEYTFAFEKCKGIHSNATTSDRAQQVDFGWYSTFANVSLSDLQSLANWDPQRDPDDRPDWDEHGELAFDGMGNLKLSFRGRRSDLYRNLQSAGFADSFQEHFAKMKHPLFEHTYYESHLRKKYNIARCYITGEWFKAKTQDECFSKKGRAWNEKFGALTRDLSVMVAIVTGARVKIGYTTCLELLRQGATVIGTTRFLADAERRYAFESDYFEFADRLHLYPLNLKSTKSIHDFVAFVKSKFKRVHILINNAAQTVRMPLRCYTNLIALEFEEIGQTLGIQSVIHDLIDPDVNPDQVLIELGQRLQHHRKATAESPSRTLALRSTLIETVKRTLGIDLYSSNAHLFLPRSEILDKLGQIKDIENSWSQQVQSRLNSIRSLFENLHPDDLLDFNGSVIPMDPFEEGKNDPSRNSWRLEPPDIHPIELFETQTINHLAPVMLLNELVPLLSPSNSDKTGPSYVINVTSIEGQFSVDVKESQHIHTNMSKASLNMLTRSGSSYYAKRGILVNSVDTGWISSTIPTWTQPPLTLRDGAMRILHPILAELEESGNLYKNYRKVQW